jgi:hypothetical protein
MNDKIDYIIGKFNFERVHVAMTAVDWKWAKQSLVPTEVPSVARLKTTARHLLEVAYKEMTTSSSGGFLAEYHSHMGESSEFLLLKFVLDSVASGSYDDA